MDVRIGLDYIVENREYVEKLGTALDTTNTTVKKQVFELLSALCAYSTDGYDRALETLEHYKVSPYAAANAAQPPTRASLSPPVFVCMVCTAHPPDVSSANSYSLSHRICILTRGSCGAQNRIARQIQTIFIFYTIRLLLAIQFCFCEMIKKYPFCSYHNPLPFDSSHRYLIYGIGFSELFACCSYAYLLMHTVLIVHNFMLKILAG